MIYQFTIPGDPIGAPRMTQRDKWLKRPCVVKYFEWRAKAQKCAGQLPDADQIVSLSWVAYFSPPVSYSKKKRAELLGKLHRNQPDRDNIDKAILDALFPKGDQAIAKGTVCKLWDITERIEVTIETLEAK